MTVIATTYEAEHRQHDRQRRARRTGTWRRRRGTCTGKNTMTVVIVEASTGSATSSAPSRAACSRALAVREVAVDVLQHHDRVVDQPADRQREAAERHHVDRRAVRRYSPKAAARIDSGIDRKIANVDLKLPRKSRITSEASTAAERRLVLQALDRVTDVARLVEDGFELHAVRAARRSSAGASRTPSTTAIVLALPCFSTGT